MSMSVFVTYLQIFTRYLPPVFAGFGLNSHLAIAEAGAFPDLSRQQLCRAELEKNPT